MNPAEYLELRGWNNKNKRFYAKQTDNKWKLTYTDNQKISEYTASHIIQTLQPKFNVVRYSFKNAAPHTIYYVGMPKNINYLTIWLVERPDYESHLWYVEDSDSNVLRYDVDLDTAEQIALDSGGRVYYSPMVFYPFPDPKQYKWWH